MSTATQKVDVLAVMDRIATAPLSETVCRQMAEARAAVAELIETQRDTLRMLEAAHRQLGMWTHLNKRIQRAKDALARAGGDA